MHGHMPPEEDTLLPSVSSCVGSFRQSVTRLSTALADKRGASSLWSVHAEKIESMKGMLETLHSAAGSSAWVHPAMANDFQRGLDALADLQDAQRKHQQFGDQPILERDEEASDDSGDDMPRAQQHRGSSQFYGVGSQPHGSKASGMSPSGAGVAEALLTAQHALAILVLHYAASVEAQLKIVRENAHTAETQLKAVREQADQSAHTLETVNGQRGQLLADHSRLLTEVDNLNRELDVYRAALADVTEGEAAVALTAAEVTGWEGGADVGVGASYSSLLGTPRIVESSLPTLDTTEQAHSFSHMVAPIQTGVPGGSPRTGVDSSPSTPGRMQRAASLHSEGEGSPDGRWCARPAVGGGALGSAGGSHSAQRVPPLALSLPSLVHPAHSGSPAPLGRAPGSFTSPVVPSLFLSPMAAASAVSRPHGRAGAASARDTTGLVRGTAELLTLYRTRALANRQLFEGQHGVTTEQAGAAGVAPGQVPVVVSQLLAQLQAQAHAQAALVDGMKAEAHTAPPTCRLAISMETEGGQAGVAVATLRQAAGAVSAGQAGAPPPESSTTDLTSMLQQRWEGSGVADTQLKIAAVEEGKALETPCHALAALKELRTGLWQALSLTAALIHVPFWLAWQLWA